MHVKETYDISLVNKFKGMSIISTHTAVHNIFIFFFRSERTRTYHGNIISILVRRDSLPQDRSSRANFEEVDAILYNQLDRHHGCGNLDEPERDKSDLSEHHNWDDMEGRPKLAFVCNPFEWDLYLLAISYLHLLAKHVFYASDTSAKH